MKKAFTLLEMIIVIVIVAILSSVGLYKLFFSVEKASSLEVKTQVHLINNAITQKMNEKILLGEVNIVETLDDASVNTENQQLFNYVLNQPIRSTDESNKALAKWIKTASNSYKVYISSSDSIIFIYDSSKALFACDESQSLCKEFMQ